MMCRLKKLSRKGRYESMSEIEKTIDYYNLNAKAFTAGTISVEFEDMQKRFLNKLPEQAVILDFGCGSGRDTKYFLEQGFRVEAIEGSKELCKIASGYTGIAVKHMLFQELSDKDRYDGIWACSSILHLPIGELENMTEDTFADFLEKIDNLTVEELWVTSDVRPGRGDEEWLNLILRKM